MIHTLIELDQFSVEVSNQDASIVFRDKSNQELVRLSLDEFDQILEVVARTEKFVDRQNEK